MVAPPHLVVSTMYNRTPPPITGPHQASWNMSQRLDMVAALAPFPHALWYGWGWGILEVIERSIQELQESYKGHKEIRRES